MNEDQILRVVRSMGYGIAYFHWLRYHYPNCAGTDVRYMEEYFRRNVRDL
jgi:hypothetical protein